MSKKLEGTSGGSGRGKPASLKRFWFPLLTVVLSFTLCLMASELILWMLGKQPWPPTQPAGDPRLAWAKVAEPDPVLGWRNKEGRFVVPAWATAYPPVVREAVVTNLPDGRRATTADGKPPGREIVALVGCSYTQGYMLSDDDTFPWKLQRDYPDVEFRNFGTAAYGTYQSILLLERLFRGPKAEHPAMVIYGFCTFHEERNTATAQWLKFFHMGPKQFHVDQPYCELDGSDGVRTHGPVCPWSYHFPLSRRLRTVGYLEYAYMRWKLRSRWTQARPVTQKLMLEMRDVCRSNGAEFVIVLLRGEAKEHYASFCRENHIEFVDCEHPAKPQWEVRVDGHPNGTLNDIWAADLSAALGRRFTSGIR